MSKFQTSKENLRCPKCGDDAVSYEEDTVIYRSVEGLEDSGAIAVESEYKTDDAGAHDARWRCACGNSWPVQDGIEIEWV